MDNLLVRSLRLVIDSFETIEELVAWLNQSGVIYNTRDEFLDVYAFIISVIYNEVIISDVFKIAVHIVVYPVDNNTDNQINIFFINYNFFDI